MINETIIDICTEVIHDILTQQSFEAWYERDLKGYLMGEENALSEEQVMAELRRAVSNKIR